MASANLDTVLPGSLLESVYNRESTPSLDILPSSGDQVDFFRCRDCHLLLRSVVRILEAASINTIMASPTTTLRETGTAKPLSYQPSVGQTLQMRPSSEAREAHSVIFGI